MNIYELKKQATPGPFTRRGCTVLAKTGWVADRDPWILGASEEFHVFSTDENHISHKEQEANARLAVHYLNNFLRALEALNKLVIIASIIRGADGNLSTNSDFLAQLDDTSKLLDELEEVA